MVLKISRGLWFVSILGVLAALLLVYASLPEEVVLMEEGTQYITISREGFFYVVLGFVTIVNSLVFIVSALFKEAEAFRSWFNGLVVCLNLFFIITLFFLNSTNSMERFNFGRIGFLIYGSVILVSLWAIAWPAYLLGRKIFTSRKV